jgi:hypothetical protein
LDGGNMAETDLRKRISESTDEEALEAISYISNWMAERAKVEGRLTNTDVILDDQAALEILGHAFPELAAPLSAISHNDKIKARTAKNLLLFIAEQKDYAFKVEDALDRPILRSDPLTMGLSTGMLLLLFLEFELKYMDTKGGKSLKISKKSPILEILMRILGL